MLKCWSSWLDRTWYGVHVYVERLSTTPFPAAPAVPVLLSSTRIHGTHQAPSWAPSLLPQCLVEWLCSSFRIFLIAESRSQVTVFSSRGSLRASPLGRNWHISPLISLRLFVFRNSAGLAVRPPCPYLLKFNLLQGKRACSGFMLQVQLPSFWAVFFLLDNKI